MKRFIEQYNGETFDLAVIGGGITGAAVAYDAASRGYSVAIIEKGDFGGATSSATSKLIHGGLRYLANAEFGLVRESLHERRTLENIAPNLVYPLPGLIATYSDRGFMNGKTVMRAGMYLYDILSYDKGRTWDRSKRLPNHTVLSRKQVLAKEGSVRPENLNGGFVYYDCLSAFPERLTLAFVKSALKYGAKAANYVRVDDFVIEGKKVKALAVTDLMNGAAVKVNASLVVNCTGPWADIVLARALHRPSERQIRRSEGIHIIVKKMVNDHMVGFKTLRGRHVFFIPWRGHTLVGTTDREYVGNPDEYRVSRASVTEFLEEVNESFGDGTIRYQDILHTYGGLRPLVETQTSGTYSQSRRYEVYDNAEDGVEGLISVEGGKYTTSRNLAEKVIEVVARKSGRAPGKCVTAEQRLAGCDIPDMAAFNESLRAEKGLPAETALYFGMAYGSEYRAVADIAASDPSLARPVGGQGEILAEVVYAIRNEMARTLIDVMMRRTGFGTLGNPGADVIEKIAAVAAAELGWDAARKKKEIDGITALLKLPE